MSEFRGTKGPHTLKVKHGGELSGRKAEIAEMQGCEAFSYSQAFIPEVDAVITWDSREPGRTERALADAALFKAAPNLLAALEAIGAPEEAELVSVSDPAIRGMLYAAVRVARVALAEATEVGERRDASALPAY